MVTHKNTNIVGGIFTYDIWCYLMCSQSCEFVTKMVMREKEPRLWLFYGTVTATSVLSDSLMGDLGSMSGGFVTRKVFRIWIQAGFQAPEVYLQVPRSAILCITFLERCSSIITHTTEKAWRPWFVLSCMNSTMTADTGVTLPEIRHTSIWTATCYQLDWLALKHNECEMKQYLCGSNADPHLKVFTSTFNHFSSSRAD